MCSKYVNYYRLIVGMIGGVGGDLYHHLKNVNIHVLRSKVFI